jgi:hypothetical protein
MCISLLAALLAPISAAKRNQGILRLVSIINRCKHVQAAADWGSYSCSRTQGML